MNASPWFGQNPQFSEDVGLYVHVPFCARRCHFCAFYLMIQEKQKIEEYVAALKKEIVLWAAREELQFRNITSVYFGGGTPTVLAPAQLMDILEFLRNKLPFGPNIEITVESTPESLNWEKVMVLKRGGVTRLSIGAQSFDPGERERLGLQPATDRIVEAVLDAKRAGLDNINLDLIYGSPGQTLTSWKESLRRVLDLAPTHLSCYALSVEEGTRFFREWKRGKISHFDSDRELTYQMVAEDRLTQAGFVRYEISNWALPGYACRHNLRYWQGLDYLGLGPSAQSYLLGVRWGNAGNLSEYSRQLARGCLPVQDREALSGTRQQKERVIFGLRKTEGVLRAWVDHLQEDVDWKRTVQNLLDQKLLSLTEDRYVLTAKGRQFADTVSQELL